MKKLTKILSVLLACAMLLAMAIPATMASAEDKLNIVIETVEANPGDTTVEVKVLVPATPNWSAIDLTFNFDPAKITFKGFTLNQELRDQSDNGEPNIYALNRNKASEGIVIVAFASAVVIDGVEGYNPGEYDYLGTLKFDVPAGSKGMADITATINKLVNNAQADVAYEITAGGINVKVEPCAECTDWDEGVVTTPATCEEDGVKTYTCQKCGNTKTEVIVASGTHAWNDGEVTKEPTTEAEGEKTYTCGACGATKTEVLEKLPFEGLDIVIETVNAKAGDTAVELKVFVPAVPNWSAIDITFNFDPAKITFKGFTLNQELRDQSDNGEPNIYALNRNNAANGEVIVAFASAVVIDGVEGYNPGEYDYLGTLKFDVPEGVADGLIAVDATIAKLVNNAQADVENRVTAGGVEITSCAHNWVESSRTPATCEADGEIVYTCSGTCGGTKTEAIPALGHDWDEGVVTTASTCTTEGVKTFTCKNDATHTKTEAIAIDADAHNFTEIGKVAPTCEAEGTITYACSYCLVEKTESVAALGHDWDDGVVTTAPTCTTEGVKTFTCKNDATHTKTEAIAIDADAHKLGAPVVVEPTCTEAGSETGTCELCGESAVVEIPALGHAWNDGEVTKEPTTEAEGEKTYTCGTCGETKTEAVEKLPAEDSDDDNTNTSDVAVASSVVVALVASAAVLVITRKKRLAK